MALVAKKSQHMDKYLVGGLVCGWELRVTKDEKMHPWKAEASSFHQVQPHEEQPYHPSASLSANQQEMGSAALPEDSCCH